MQSLPQQPQHHKGEIMAKITRSVLKGIVKECLVEILLEGIEGEDADMLEESLDVDRPQRKQTKNKLDSRKNIQKRQKMLDSKKAKVRVKQEEQQASDTISNLTQDPTMAAIFADTAATTLQEQVERKGKMGYRPAGDAASQIAHENDPSDLFDGANNWEDLAFSAQKPSG